jgi:anti-sigma factor RsiW
LECSQMQELITAYADGELDASQRQTTEKHLAECERCAGVLASLTAMKSVMGADALVFNAPGSLVKRIDSLIDKAADPTAKRDPAQPRIRSKWWPISVAAAVVLAGGIAAYFAFAPSAQQRLEAEAALDHQQAVAANHLVDTTTTDPQKLAQWFSTKGSFVPTIPGHMPAGMVLIGGRLDRLAGHPVATLVFRNGTTVAGFFQWPSSAAQSAASSATIGGADVAAWNTGNVGFAIVSTTSGPAGLADFAQLFTADGCGPH